MSTPEVSIFKALYNFHLLRLLYQRENRVVDINCDCFNASSTNTNGDE
jgi:hypothetical protein